MRSGSKDSGLARSGRGMDGARQPPSSGPRGKTRRDAGNVAGNRPASSRLDPSAVATTTYLSPYTGLEPRIVATGLTSRPARVPRRSLTTPPGTDCKN